jgi:LemA protein
MNITIIVIVLIILMIVIMYNTILKKKNKVKTAFSSLDVMLKKRCDLMPNLVSMVKSYMNHESDTLIKLTELRSRVQNTTSIDENIELNQQIENEMKNLIVSIENYPNLKANENFLKMQSVLNELEEQISAARRTYNAHVEAYNTFIGMIPMNIFALLFGFKEFKLFEISSSERESKIWM